MDLSEFNLPLKRHRKSSKQMQILANAYSKSKTWSKEAIRNIAHNTGLSEYQVYKWLWDQNKKYMEEPCAANIHEMICTEVLGQSKLDNDLQALQLNYKKAMIFTNYWHCN